MRRLTRPRPKRSPSADTPRGRNAQFAVLFRQAIEAHEAETGRGSTAGDRAAIKDKLRADRPDLAWWDNLTAESTVS